MREKPRFLAISEAARELGISVNSLRVMANDGRIACVRAAYGCREFDPAIIAAEKKRREAKALEKVLLRRQPD